MDTNRMDEGRAGTSRRDLIKKALKASVGAYVGMAILESFVGPTLGTNGMPAHAVSVPRHN
jgi:hypothetical protein